MKLENIKVGQMVELSNDFGTYITGRVDGTWSGFKLTYIKGEPERELFHTISIEGIGSEFRDYEWTLVSVAGVSA